MFSPLPPVLLAKIAFKCFLAPWAVGGIGDGGEGGDGFVGGWVAEVLGFFLSALPRWI
jgi:hypothetical protein